MSDRLLPRSHALAATLAQKGWAPDIDPKKGKCWRYSRGGVVYRLPRGPRPWVASRADYPIHRYRTMREAMEYLMLTHGNRR